MFVNKRVYLKTIMKRGEQRDGREEGGERGRGRDEWVEGKGGRGKGRIGGGRVGRGRVS